ncbi:putative bifunctional diguanylate cyclase/phosphodiesterase [Aeromicrobium wangtongii]|uniref:Bifunctional diguanylate cyclase/phosphodiesterase n=1 Tax=Aeromicrobium wangtongii TaxID=2969247 RepID=A0ABY5M837_9ACTN|nr:bifunctional diguanylate cyclase/phosphodiesterase [Aeromicrobium wangtongii]MCD9196806.1 bifunctional diguanylate cyclase/phosphodiesterase [Aeromicrobium wangtongii]UUP14315.1 bifunctional diguanylate cyclase/phosphodiesterase [Aeromicrobium wangtongii]
MSLLTRGAPRSRLALAQRIVAPLPWAVMLVGILVDEILQSTGQHTPTVLLTALAIFFPLLVLQTALAAAIHPKRRLALVLLIAALSTWALGSILVNAARVDQEATFPGNGEWLFLVSYLGMAGYLLRDVDRRQARPARSWLDIVIICGGTASLACLLVVTPVQAASHQEGVSLLLALIYPLADMILALLVLGQSLLQTRTDRRKSLMIGGAFLLLGVADSALALQGSASTYDFGNVSYALWGASFSLLVAAACRPPQSVIRAVPKSADTPVLMGAGVVALIVLTLRPDDTLAYYMLPPSILTLVAVGARLVLALRDANRANDAFALSQTDDLTKLPNRRAVRAWLSTELAARNPLALMLLDLDGFKDINDSLGHRAGDTVLRLVAVRMTEGVDAHARVARLGGDEFAIIMDTTDEIVLMETAHHVLRELAKPLLVEDIEITPAGSIGVTVAGPEDDDGSEVLRRADVAMYQAKNAGLGVALYDSQLDDFTRSRLQMAEELRKAIADGQIEVWYQPQLDAATMQVCGLEALVRWRHPIQGVISPVSFLPAARRAGLMGQLSEVVAKQAVEDFDARRRAGLDVAVAINCAPPELLGPTFLPRLYAAIEKWDIPVDRLVLEVTEDTFLDDPQHTREVLLELRSHGVQVAIDDYGTGFSSLTYLRNLPVQELKIDRALIANVASDARSRMIVASTIQLAHALEMRIVAEGVENAADLVALVAMGIDTVQGYHLARPMPADQVERWVRDWTRNNNSSESSAKDVADPEQDREESR